ncbi:hypothetical protein C8A03DRAFT_15533 [Achaetomium macrosporum]|uniref:Uncharacterized protein n=1 Tax=Achaetomium macrosporum TaxID=79813 RepID=A0AAN7CAW4_9PEZI|nr:hypothetical protein C8A03DRAFT_15533 [Achaetomium macrosporum]
MQLQDAPPDLAVLASFATIAAADYLETFTTCPWIGSCDSEGWWYTCCGRYSIYPTEGCHYYNSDNVGVPDMNTLCMDWNNRRGHFLFDNQPNRCIKQTSERQENGVTIGKWDEVPCTW